jgi:hypothetical protein
VDHTIVCAKYDSIPSSSTDGYQVYLGNGVQAYDTSCNLNETFSTIYYVAFGYDAGNNLIGTTTEATMESPHMAELANVLGNIIMLGIALALIIIAFWRNSIFLQIMAGIVSMALGIYWINIDASLWYNIIIGSALVSVGFYMMIMVGYDLLKGGN